MYKKDKIIKEANITPNLKQVTQIPGVTNPQLDQNVSIRNLKKTSSGPQFSQGYLTLTGTGDTIVNTGFKAKLIEFETYASRSAGSNKYSGSKFSGYCDKDGNNKSVGFGNMSNDTSLGSAFRINNYSQCVYAWTYDTDNHYSYGGVSNISDTDFTLNIGQHNDDMYVIRKAFG